MSNLELILNIGVVCSAIYLVMLAVHFYADVSSSFVIKHRLNGFKEHVIIALYLLVSVTTIIYAFDVVKHFLELINKSV